MLAARGGAGRASAPALASAASISVSGSAWTPTTPTPSRRCCSSRSAARRAELMMRLIAAIDHDRDVLGDRGGDADILLDHEHRHVAVFAEAHQHFLDLGDDDRRQPFGRLVHDEQLRVGQKRARDRQHLLFAARELAAAMVLAFGKAGKRLVDAIDGPGAAPHPGGQAQMLGDAERAPQPSALAEHSRRLPARSAPG